MTTFWKSICGTLIAAAVIAGASGLVLSQVTAAEVADLKKTVDDLSDKDRENAQKVASIDTKVESTKDTVERIEDKLDRLIEKSNPTKR